MNRVSVARLRELFSYDPKTGLLTRKASGGNQAAGAIATAMEAKGYLRIGVDGVRLKVHVVCWAIHTGTWPIHQIDHWNGDKADNRFLNLRPATNQQNAANQKKPKHNTSGVKGVSRSGNKFVAGIKVNGTRIHLGTFHSL